MGSAARSRATPARDQDPDPARPGTRCGSRHEIAVIEAHGLSRVLPDRGRVRYGPGTRASRRVPDEDQAPEVWWRTRSDSRDIDPPSSGSCSSAFTNPERVSMPDFDVDFAERAQEEGYRPYQRTVRAQERGPDRDLRPVHGKSASGRGKGHGHGLRKAQDLTVGVPNVVEGHRPRWNGSRQTAGPREKMAEDP